MAKTLKPGDKVSWESSGGSSAGKVVKKVTKQTKVKGHVAKASKDNPEYLVESSASKKRAVHKAQSLKRAS